MAYIKIHIMHYNNVVEELQGVHKYSVISVQVLEFIRIFKNN